MIVVNYNTDFYLAKTSIGSLVPKLEQISPELAKQNFFFAVGVWVLVMSIIQVFSNLLNVYRKIGSVGRFLNDASPALIPIIEWGIAIVCTFTYTSWAWDNLLLVMLMLLPGYCLINSKMIVCNVTHMETESHSWTFTVFLLFPLNYA